MTQKEKLTIVGREAVAVEMQAQAAEPPSAFKITRLQGQFSQSDSGPVWGVAVVVPSALIGKPIRILCAVRSGVFILIGEAMDAKGGATDGPVTTEERECHPG